MSARTDGLERSSSYNRRTGSEKRLTYTGNIHTGTSRALWRERASTIGTRKASAIEVSRDESDTGSM